MRSPLGRFLASKRGAAAVELAVAAPVLVLVLFGLLDTGRMLWINHTLQDAADGTARYALVNRISDPAALAARMTERLVASAGADASVVVVPRVENGIAFVEITGTLPFLPLGGMIGIPAVTLSGRAVIPIVGEG